MDDIKEPNNQRQDFQVTPGAQSQGGHQFGVRHVEREMYPELHVPDRELGAHQAVAQDKSVSCNEGDYGDFEPILPDEEYGTFEPMEGSDGDDSDFEPIPPDEMYDLFEPIEGSDGDDLRNMPPYTFGTVHGSNDSNSTEDGYGDFEPILPDEEYGTFEPIPPFAEEFDLEQLYLDPEEFSRNFPIKAKDLLGELGVRPGDASFAKEVLSRDLSLVAGCVGSGNTVVGKEEMSPVRETDYKVRTKAAADLVRMGSGTRNEILLNTLRRYPQILNNIAEYVRAPDTFCGDFAVVTDRTFTFFRTLTEEEKKTLLERGSVTPEDAALLLYRNINRPIPAASTRANSAERSR
ncbi:MAG: hypothetical protein LBB15_00060 [Puniceicoccales bacterium]|jgi:hypothetical protein|nr:hypothetical protein [Puniceicoccales bacterium]